MYLADKNSLQGTDKKKIWRKLSIMETKSAIQDLFFFFSFNSKGLLIKKEYSLANINQN